MRYLFPIFQVLFLANTLAGEPLIKTKYIYARGGETLRELLEFKVGIPKSTLDKDRYFEKIKDWNPSLSDSSSLAIGERVYVEIPYRVFLMPRKYPESIPPSLASQESLKRETASEKTIIAAIKKNDKEDKEKSWNYSLFYAFSKGSFQENILNSDITTTSSQDSPFTLGFSTYKKINYDFNYSGSLYISKLDNSISDLGESISIPWEYGLNSYIGYQRANWPVEIYTGLDYESFSSYNTEELPFGESLSTREHALTFMTFGVAKKFSWFNKQFLAKASYSQSIISSQSRPSLVNPEEFSGSKFILYLNMKASKKWFYHGFYKQHDLEGATALHIARMGVGFGYVF